MGQGLYEQFARAGLPTVCCRADSTIEEVLAVAGPIGWFSLIAIAECHIDGPFPEPLLESLTRVHELVEFAAVRAVHRAPT